MPTARWSWSVRSGEIMEEWFSRLAQCRIPCSTLFESASAFRPVLIRIIWVMIGGGIGASCRYGVSLAAVKLFGPRFPWGTLTVNLSGCFLIGVSFALAERTNLMGPTARLFFVTGFLGGLTTFSTYAMETVDAMKPGTFWIAAINFITNNVLGLGLVIAGIWLIRTLRP
jgi:CrcB protein